MKRDDFFRYGDKETEYLKRRDKRLAKVIEKVGKIERTVIPDLFAALVHSIVGQQISTRAHETIWARMKHGLREITPQAIDRMPEEELQRFGISFRKAAYIKSAAKKIVSGEFDIQALETLPDEEVCATERLQMTSDTGAAIFYRGEPSIVRSSAKMMGTINSIGQ